MTNETYSVFDKHIAESDEALALGFDSIEEFRKQKIISINCKDFLSRELPQREFIIQPCLPKQGLVMCFAKRGVGKTYFALLLACKIAQGQNVFDDRWKINKKWKVLYIDGEMPASTMQERLKTLVVDDDVENLSIITRDIQRNGNMPNIATLEGQNALEPHIEKADVIIIDNLSTLSQFGKENEAASWDPIANWALKQRSCGKSIIFIHHAGKNNSQRGTSKKEDILDTVINLRHPSNYNNTEGARFEVHFEKSRGFAGEESKPFEIKLTIEDDKANWHVSDIDDLETKQVFELAALGMTHRAIANEMGISESKAYRILKKTN